MEVKQQTTMSDINTIMAMLAGGKTPDNDSEVKSTNSFESELADLEFESDGDVVTFDEMLSCMFDDDVSAKIERMYYDRCVLMNRDTKCTGKDFDPELGEFF